jgi:hypothetical protein
MTTSFGRTHPYVLIAVACLMAVIAAGAILPQMQLASMAAVLLLVLLVPLLGVREPEWLSSWNMLWYSAFVAVFLRAIYISFDIPNEEIINRIFLADRPKEFLLWPMVVLIGGMATTALGYMLGPKTAGRTRLAVLRGDHWSERRLTLALVLLMAVAITGVVLFVKNTVGVLLLENISAHRGLARELSEYRAYGYLRLMASMSDLVCYLAWARMMMNRSRRWRYRGFFLLAVLSSLFFYAFTSSRGGVLIIFVNLTAIAYFLRGKRLNFKLMLPFAVIGLYLLKVLTAIREWGIEEAFARAKFSPLRLFDPIVFTTNLIDVSKTAHIMNAIPRLLDYQLGKTVALLALAWIPRDLWPDKPVVNVDNTLGMAISGTTLYGSSGLPPGIVAESFWNFGYPGIVVGCFLLGFLLRWVDTNFREHWRNRNAVLLYVLAFMQLGVAFAGSSAGSSLAEFALVLLPLALVLHAITVTPKAPTA